MADISMCRGDGNVICDNCYRKTAQAEYMYQSFINGKVILGVCDMYWPLIKEKLSQSDSIVHKLSKSISKKYNTYTIKKPKGSFINAFKKEREDRNSRQSR